MRPLRLSENGLEPVAVEDLPRLLADGSSHIWVDIMGPEASHLEAMERLFRFHPLAIEDTRNQRQRPKAEEYDDHLFLILNPATAGLEADETFRELDVFVAERLLVTVHPAGEPVVADAERRLSRRSNGEPPTLGHLLYVLLDTVVDTYFPLLDGIDADLAEVEDEILDEPRPDLLARLVALKRKLVDIRRVVGPQREMLHVLLRQDQQLVDAGALRYQFRDVYDHLLRVTDAADTFRDLLTSLVDLYMSSVSNRLNRVVNRLTRVTVVIGALAVVTGFYGMNFERTWPAFGSPWGTGFALLAMAGVAGLLLWIFRRDR